MRCYLLNAFYAFNLARPGNLFSLLPRCAMSKNRAKQVCAQGVKRHKCCLGNNSIEQWQDLCIPPLEFRPRNTLNIGQCFNWHRISGDTWIGVVGKSVFAVREEPNTTLIKCIGGTEIDHESTEFLIKDYFQLDVSLVELYKSWSKKDLKLAKMAEALPGVRVIRQNPLECVISFICSSNNNIQRISGMLQKLRSKYGTPLELVQLDTIFMPQQKEEIESQMFYSFPSLEQLSTVSDADLRSLGFGYRAAYICKTVSMLNNMEQGGENWLLSLRSSLDYGYVKTELSKLSGVGPKVADCIALFSLDKICAIPVDVHVWNIACRDFDPSLQQAKSMTPTVYNRVCELFQNRYGSHAGWAHSLRFAAELPEYRNFLPQDLMLEMKTFSINQKKEKASMKARKIKSKSIEEGSMM